MVGFLKRLIARKDAVADDVAAILNTENQKWQAMNREDLVALNGTDLVSAAVSRIFGAFGSCEDEKERITYLNKPQRIIYTVYMYESEVNNGGLCQYFSNDSRFLAPLLCEALEQIGAKEHRMHFESFIHDNAIDVPMLESVAPDAVRGISKPEKRYPFEKFDDVFYDMPPLKEAMSSYIRAHLASF